MVLGVSHKIIPFTNHILCIQSSPHSSSDPSMNTSVEVSLPDAKSEEVEEIPRDAASWSLSSAKPGNGADQLLEGNPETYWQSDGPQPHRVTVTFYKKTKISDIWILFSFKSDESYTPQQISIRIGNGYHDLQEIQVVDLREPEGWVRIPVAFPPENSERVFMPQEGATLRDRSFGGAYGYIRCFCLQIAVLSNHQNGRDTHMRNIKLFAPKIRNSVTFAPIVHENGMIQRLDRGMALSSPEMLSMALIR